MQARRCGVVDTPKKIFGTIHQVFRWEFELGRSTSPRSNCQAFKAPLSPRRALLLEPTARQNGWWNQTSSSQISITLVGLEARAVTKSETEAERLRAHARRSLELARAIADQEASRALRAYAANSWKGQMPSSGRTRTDTSPE